MCMCAYLCTHTRVKGAAIDCDIFWIAVLMHVVEYEENKKYGVSAVKCYLIIGL